MRVLHISYSDKSGGAAIAAYRLHESLRNMGVDSWMYVQRKISDEKNIKGVKGYLRSNILKIRWILSSKVMNCIYRTDEKRKYGGLRSHGIFGSNLINKINSSDFDLINLHWICGETMSISDISKLEKPFCWTFHDMWAICSTEHYAVDESWKIGYSAKIKESSYLEFIFDRFIWKKKYSVFNREMRIVSPSLWLAEIVSKSPMAAKWKIITIPNPLDLNVWKPQDKITAKKKYGFDLSAITILMTAFSEIEDLRKGFDLGLGAIKSIQSCEKRIEVVVLGSKIKEELNINNDNVKISYFNKITNDNELSDLYNASDIMLLPSRMDNLPNTGIEAQACGVPIIGFNVGGIGEIVEDGRTGYLIDPYNIHAMGKAIYCLANDFNLRAEMGKNARNKAIKMWDNILVARKYIGLYEDILK